MKNSKRVVSVFILFILSIIGVNAQAQRQPYLDSDRQVSNILQRLERSSSRFRGSLNTALVQDRIDQTRPQNDINSFESAFASAINQFRDQFARHRAGTADVENVLQEALSINGFMIRNRLNTRAQDDWASVRTDLNVLANAYGVSWQWDRKAFPPVISNQSYPLAARDLDQLIRRIENGGDTFSSSITDAFDRSRYDPTRSEGNMNDAVAAFKKATDQLRNSFDTGRSVVGDVERLLGRSTPIEIFMRNNRVTDSAQSNWSTLRRDLNTLASAYNITPNWANTPSPQPGTAPAAAISSCGMARVC